jgi:tight adherence protein B
VVSPTWFALAVTAFVGGLIVVVAGFRGALPRLRAAEDDPGRLVLRLGFGLGGFFGALVVTRWPVAALYLGLGGWFLPTLAQARGERRAAIDRVEAIAVWAETLRDTMAASAGIQEALRLSAKVAPEPIRTEVTDLALRLQHESTVSALRRFAADMRHPLADTLVASLVMASSRHGGRLQEVLAMAAKSARDTASMWRRIEGSRAKLYAQSRMTGWVSLTIIAMFVLVRREFLSPFDSVGGQIALAVVCTAFFAAGVSLYRLGKPIKPRRIFQGVERWSDPLVTDVGVLR